MVSRKEGDLLNRLQDSLQGKLRSRLSTRLVADDDGREQPVSASDETVIRLDYHIEPSPRWGYGKPRHQLLEKRIETGVEVYESKLHALLQYAEEFRRISVSPPSEGTEPYWCNGYLPGLDAAVLYGMLVEHNPRSYVEIGSGHSTRFARRAITNHDLRTQIVSIDPTPRVELHDICDTVVRVGLENSDLSVFESLAAGDILFVDGSHRCFTNSDVTVVFLDILPRLAPGVIVQIHDVQLPDDYPLDWSDRYYSEQYLLAVLLLADSLRPKIQCPNYFISTHPKLSHVLDAVWSAPELAGAEPYGVSFWFEV